VVRGLAAALVALACSAPPALAGWSTDPVTVTPTTASIPLVEGCADGAYGVFVAWQEGSPTGLLRAQHLLPTGDLDPAWPASGAVACNVAAARTELTALPDRLGGSYLFWKEANTLYVNRLDPGGAVAAGWPARGRSLGSIHPDSPRPGVIEDGANGFYAVWTGSLRSVTGARLGPANTGAGGWPDGARTIFGAAYPYETTYWPAVAPAPDGGIFVAWALANEDPDPSLSSWRLRRLTPSGANASGWPDEGAAFGSFARSLLGGSTKGSLLGLGADGRGGVFMLIGNPVGPHPYETNAALVETRLYRIQGDSQSAADWPAEGRVMADAPDIYRQYAAGTYPDYSYRVMPDGRDGAFAGVPEEVLHSGAHFRFVKCDPAGVWSASAGVSGLMGGYEVGPRGDGGLLMGTFFPHGPFGPYEPNAFIGIDQTPPPAKLGWSEYHPECCTTWYSDIGLAPTEDGGGVLLWSQVNESVGLFARRFNPAGGEVTAVETETATVPALSRLRFVRGVGVTATINLGSTEPGRFELFDLAGRRIASQSVGLSFMAQRDAPPEFTLAGTAHLPSGLYFGRLMQGAMAVSEKVVIAR
jgi:hypothetical protein